MMNVSCCVGSEYSEWEYTMETCQASDPIVVVVGIE